jgi:type I restriction enzyme S subunit
MVAISEVAEVNPSFPRTSNLAPESLVSFLPMAAVSESGIITVQDERPFAEVSKGYTYFAEGDVLIAKITPCMENGKATFVHKLKHPAGFGSTEFHVLRPGSDIDGKYLFYMIWNPLFRKVAERNMTGTAGQKRVPSSFLKDFKLPLPLLPEQKRIAAILDKADSIRRKRQEAVRLTEELLRSVFLDMFGDPVTNPKGWEVVTVRDLVTEVKYGTSDKASYEGQYSVLRMNNITYLGGWNFTDLKRIDIPEKELSKYLVRKGDILFNRTNSKELVGKTAVYRRDDPMAYAGYLIRIRPNKQNNSEYIAAYLNSTHGKTILESMCKSIVGMANINAQELQEIAIMQPPLELQDQYAALVHSVGRVKEKLITSSEVTDTLFDSLLQRAFKGEL